MELVPGNIDEHKRRLHIKNCILYLLPAERSKKLLLLKAAYSSYTVNPGSLQQQYYPNYLVKVSGSRKAGLLHTPKHTVEAL